MVKLKILDLVSEKLIINKMSQCEKVLHFIYMGVNIRTLVEHTSVIKKNTQRTRLSRSDGDFGVGLERFVCLSRSLSACWSDTATSAALRSCSCPQSRRRGRARTPPCSGLWCRRVKSSETHIQHTHTRILYLGTKRPLSAIQILCNITAHILSIHFTLV